MNQWGNVQTAARATEVQGRPAPSGELVDLGRPHRAPLGQLRLQQTPKHFSSRREGILLGLLVLALHGAPIYWVSQKPTPVLPVPPASANAAYLKNPAPQYPSLAQRRGWEGTVLLRVRVLASGKPGEIQLQKSSGRQQLDDAALAAVNVGASCRPSRARWTRTAGSAYR